MVNLSHDHPSFCQQLSSQDHLSNLIYTIVWSNTRKSPSKQADPAPITLSFSSSTTIKNNSRSQEKSVPISPTSLNRKGVLFDIMVHCLGLLINLVEENEGAKDVLRNLKVPFPSSNSSPTSLNSTNSSTSCLYILLSYFLTFHETQLLLSDSLENLLQNKGRKNSPSVEISSKEGKSFQSPPQTLYKLETSLREISIPTSYLALLLGCLIQGQPKNQSILRSWLPDKSFRIVKDVLQDFISQYRSALGISIHQIQGTEVSLESKSSSGESRTESNGLNFESDGHTNSRLSWSGSSQMEVNLNLKDFKHGSGHGSREIQDAQRRGQKSLGQMESVLDSLKIAL